MRKLSHTRSLPLPGRRWWLAVALAGLFAGPALAQTDLVVSTTQAIPAGTYNSITVTGSGAGTLGGDVTVNTAVVVQSGGLLNDGNNLFLGAATFTLQAGGKLVINRPLGIRAAYDPNNQGSNLGAVRTTGTRSFSSDASYEYAGSASPQNTGSGLPSQVRNLTISASNDVALDNPVAVAQLLTLSGTANLTLNNNALTLLSSASGTALIVNSGTGVVNGATGVMQRYLDASGNTGSSGYRHYSAPVSGMTVSGLATTGSGGSFTPVTNAAYNSAANSQAVSPYPTVYGYDQSRVGSTSYALNLSAFDQGYYSPSNTLNVGQGYAVQIGNGEKVAFTGTFTTGNQTINNLGRGSSADAGWQLIGNPYPSPLDWGTVATSQLNNVNSAAYVFQSTSAYAGRYTSFTNGVGANTGVIAAGQGFFVRTTSAASSGSINLTNANRVTTYGPTPALQRTADTRPLLHLSLAAAGTVQDEAFLYFQPGATDAFDGLYDAYKLANPSGYYLATASADAPAQGLSIDGRAPLTGAATVPLWLAAPAGSYTLTATELLNFAGLAGGTQVQLRDALTGTLTDLATTPSYAFGVAAGASSSGRFSLLLSPNAPLATLAAGASQPSVSLAPNPADGGLVQLSVAGLPSGSAGVQATLLNAVGQEVGRYPLPVAQGAATATLATAGLGSGLYLVRLSCQDAQGQLLTTLPTQRLSLR